MTAVTEGKPGQAGTSDPFLNLLAYKHNEFTQNGEDGIIARICDVIARGHSTCCKFGA
jgi:hypothetical protein